MPIYQTGGYEVRPSGVDKVKQAIKEFVAYVKANEPGTQCISPGNNQTIQLVSCIYSSSRMRSHRFVMASQKL